MIAYAKAGEAPAVKKDLAAVPVPLFLRGIKESGTFYEEDGGTQPAIRKSLHAVAAEISGKGF